LRARGIAVSTSPYDLGPASGRRLSLIVARAVQGSQFTGYPDFPVDSRERLSLE
jgi:hypothetical protein